MISVIIRDNENARQLKRWECTRGRENIYIYIYIYLFSFFFFFYFFLYSIENRTYTLKSCNFRSLLHSNMRGHRIDRYAFVYPMMVTREVHHGQCTRRAHVHARARLRARAAARRLRAYLITRNGSMHPNAFRQSSLSPVCLNWPSDALWISKCSCIFFLLHVKNFRRISSHPPSVLNSHQKFSNMKFTKLKLYSIVNYDIVIFWLAGYETIHERIKSLKLIINWNFFVKLLFYLFIFLGGNEFVNNRCAQHQVEKIVPIKFANRI